GALGAALIGAVLTGAVWASSPYLRQRVSAAVEELQIYGAGDINTPTGLRIEYWKKSLAFIAEAPLIGHGTGTIPALFRRDTTARHDQSRARHHEPAQPDPGGDDRARPRRRRRARRDVARPSCFVS